MPPPTANATFTAAPETDLAAMRAGMTSDLCTRLVTQHGPLVMAACRRILRDEGLAEDAAQETFVLLVKQARHLSPRTSVAGWLYHAACHMALNHQRTAMRRQSRESSPEAAAATLPDDSTQAAARWQDLEPHLDAAMLALSKRQRDLVVQCYFEDQTQRAAAKALGISETIASRELSAAIEALRRFFAKRGLGITGSALIALLGAHAAQAATLSATAMISATTVAASGAALASTLLSVKLTLSFVAVLVISAAVYELASGDSGLHRWLGGRSAPQATAASDADRDAGAAQAKAKEQAAAELRDKERLLAEAKAIWAKAPSIDKAAFDRLLYEFSREKDPDKQFAMLQSAGITVTRATFDRLRIQTDQADAMGAKLNFWQDLIERWVNEAPREGIAWAYHLLGPSPRAMEEMDTILTLALAAIRRDPASWAAFMAASPDPRIATHADFWLLEAADPGSAWAKASAAGVSDASIRLYLTRMLHEDTPERALQALLRCPDAAFKSRAITGLASRLSPQQLLDLANQQFSGDAPLANFLRAIAGDPAAGYGDAAARALESEDPASYETQFAEWSKAAVAKIYAQWLKIDPAAAMSQAIASNNREYLDLFMAEAFRSGRYDEQSLFRSLAKNDPDKRDSALAAFYRAVSPNDLRATLQRIIQSDTIEDQVAAAKPLLKDWAAKSPRDAAAWLGKLPAGEERRELAASIAATWVNAGIEPGTAIRFAQQEGVGLSHDFPVALAFGLRGQPEPAIRAMLEAYRADPQYDQVVVWLACYRLPNQPASAFRFIADHAVGDWQTIAVNETIRWLKNNDSRAMGFTQALPTLDLTQVDPSRLATAAQLYIQRLSDTGQLQQALNWTLRLPPAAAPLARAEAASHLKLTQPAQRTGLTNWIQSANLPPEERASLLQQVSQRTQGTP